jgi:hypothetical protein
MFEPRPPLFKAYLAASCSILWVSCGSAVAQVDSQPGQGRANLKLLVSNTVRNEWRAWKHPQAYYEYEEVDWSPEETTVSEEVETPEGVFGRLIEVNGHAPGAKRSRKEAQRLERLVKDPAARRSLVRGEQEDIERRMALLKEFPNAFRFAREDAETNGVVHLGFEPDPAYRPSSHEGLALRGMEGTLWIDSSSERILKIDGTLIHDVTLGWGVVVRLRRGGHFSMEQAQVSPGSWELTSLSASVKGKIFLIKNLNLQMKEIHRSFKRVPDHLNAEQALSMLLGRRTASQASGK